MAHPSLAQVFICRNRIVRRLYQDEIIRLVVNFLRGGIVAGIACAETTTSPGRPAAAHCKCTRKRRVG